jgi:multimeric flavodoxin WrbA
MKVVAINGSPKKEGNTYHGINLVAEELKNEGIEVEIIHVGNNVIRGCMACGECSKNKNEKCDFNDYIDNDSIHHFWTEYF